MHTFSVVAACHVRQLIKLRLPAILCRVDLEVVSLLFFFKDHENGIGVAKNT